MLKRFERSYDCIMNLMKSNIDNHYWEVYPLVRGKDKFQCSYLMIEMLYNIV